MHLFDSFWTAIAITNGVNHRRVDVVVQFFTFAYGFLPINLVNLDRRRLDCLEANQKKNHS